MRSNGRLSLLSHFFMRIVFLGTGEIGVPSLQALAASAGHEVCAVFTQPDRPAGRDFDFVARLDGPATDDVPLADGAASLNVVPFGANWFTSLINRPKPNLRKSACNAGTSG